VQVTPRIKLYGKKAPQEKIIKEIRDLLEGNATRPYPLTVAEIAKVLGVCRKTVYNYINRVSKENSISRLPSGHFFLPKSPDSEFRIFNKHHRITSDQLISEWMDDLLTRKQGNPIKCWRYRLSSLEVVCNTCEVKPRDLILSRKTTEKIMRSFAKYYQNDDVKQCTRGRKKSGLNTAVYSRVQAVRDFCGFYDLTWKKGTTGIMSQKVPGHGKYADIRFTDEEFDKADSFIREKWGLDSDIYRWFWIGIESCARFGALYNMENDYSVQKNETGKIIYIMAAYETKTEHIRGGKWTKYITREGTQKSIDLLRSRGITKIHESKCSKYKFQIEITKKLSQVYQHLGKNAEYFLHHPTHVLRHIGAHYWLSKTNYNYGIISEVGGWNTIDELKKSYGQIPPEKILEIIQ